MLDPKLIRGDLPMLAGQLARRQFVLDVEALSGLEAKRKSAQTAMETLQAERNRVSKAIGQAKAKGARYRVGPELELPGYGCEVRSEK